MPERLGRVVAAALCATALLAGCAGATNAGGKTPCGEFLSMRTDDKDATVAKLLKERNGRNASTNDVVAKRTALVEACAPADRADAAIGGLG